MKKSYEKPRQHIKKQKHYITNKGPSRQSYGLSSSHVWMWELDHKERWVPKNWCSWTVVLEKILESPLDGKEIKPLNLKGNQPWIFIGRTDAEAEAPILWPPDAKNWLLRKDPVAGKGWRQEEKRTTEDEVVGWHHWLDGHEFEQAQGVGDGQGGLACCSPGGQKESDTTEWIQLNRLSGNPVVSNFSILRPAQPWPILQINLWTHPSSLKIKSQEWKYGSKHLHTKGFSKGIANQPSRKNNWFLPTSKGWQDWRDQRIEMLSILPTLFYRQRHGRLLLLSCIVLLWGSIKSVFISFPGKGGTQ